MTGHGSRASDCRSRALSDLEEEEEGQVGKLMLRLHHVGARKPCLVALAVYIRQPDRLLIPGMPM